MNHIFLLEDDETLGRGIAMASDRAGDFRRLPAQPVQVRTEAAAGIGGESGGMRCPGPLLWTEYGRPARNLVEENALSVTVKRLRSKPEYLKTVYGIGYTWAVKP